LSREPDLHKRIAHDRNPYVTNRNAGSQTGLHVDLAPPSFLIDCIAIEEWKKLSPLFESQGLLDSRIRPLLAGYCNAVARAVRAEQALALEGRYYRIKTGKGSIMRRRHPAAQDAEEGWAAVRQFARQLGICRGLSKEEDEGEKRCSMFK
jgi:phage terminase small subunit